MSVVTRALTSDDDAEIQQCLHTLKGRARDWVNARDSPSSTPTPVFAAMSEPSANGTGLMHESFFYTDASRFTRAHFAW
eukprot:4797985-Pyramimonas_sp.AAC.1